MEKTIFMTDAQIKAREIIIKMQLQKEPLMFEQAKQFALIAVDEIIKSEPRLPSDVDWDDVGGTHKYYYEAEREEALKYWQEVKQEIEKL